MNFKFLSHIFILLLLPSVTCIYGMEVMVSKKDLNHEKLPPKNFAVQALKTIPQILERFNSEEKERYLRLHTTTLAKLFISAYIGTSNEQEAEILFARYTKLLPNLRQEITRIINTKNSMGETQLHQAKSAQEAKKLIKLGADINLESKLLQKPFTAALSHGSLNPAHEILRAMNIEPPLAIDIRGFTTLDYALLADDSDLASRILKNPENSASFPAELNRLRGKKPYYSPLLLAVVHSPESIESLISKGADVNLADNDGSTPFLLATQALSVEELILLMKHGALPEITDKYGNNALFYAVQNSSSKIMIRFLIEVIGLNPNDANKEGITPLGKILLFLGNVPKKFRTRVQDTILELLKSGADANTELTNVNIPLLGAYMNTEFLKNYIDIGKANVNFLQQDSKYPLASAVFEITYALPTFEYSVTEESVPIQTLEEETSFNADISKPSTSIPELSWLPEFVENVDTQEVAINEDYLQQALSDASEGVQQPFRYGPIRSKLNYDIIKYLIQKGAKIAQEHKDFIVNNSTDERLIDLIQQASAFNSQDL